MRGSTVYFDVKRRYIMCPFIYLSLYVELSPSLSQQSHHIHFAFLSCQVKSCHTILCTETQSAHPVQLYIVTLCVMSSVCSGGRSSYHTLSSVLS